MFIKKLKLLPVLVVVAGIMMVVRAGDIVQAISGYDKGGRINLENINVSSGQAFAAKEDEMMDKEMSEEQMSDDTPMMEPEDVDEDISRWTDALDTDLELPELRVEMFKELIDRRKELDKRQRVLQQREALLRAAEQELERKYQELTQLSGEIDGLLEKQSEEEMARIQSLVTTYEGMKAKDAARIFNTLSMDVLLEVMAGMSERKIAPVLAAMETERARQVTILLAEEKKLPSLPVR